MHSFYLPPGNLDLIAVTGADAAKLLQGQLTCDVDAVPDPGFARGALCNNKGRVFATFILVRNGPAFHLVLGKGLGTILIAAVKKYLPFYKCELRQAAADEYCGGAAGAATITALGLDAAALPPQGKCAAVADGWICTLDQSQQQYLVYSHKPLPVPAGTSTGTLNDWLMCGMRSGQFPFVAGDQEKYTPQELHLDRHEYVSFTKGCYTGQEIVARMHYRGKMKKLLFLLEAAAPGAAPADPMEVLDANDHLLGTSIKLLHANGEVLALAPLPAELENNTAALVKNAAGLRFSSRIF